VNWKLMVIAFGPIVTAFVDAKWNCRDPMEVETVG
jgi:hypothetical protein